MPSKDNSKKLQSLNFEGGTNLATSCNNTIKSTVNSTPKHDPSINDHNISQNKIILKKYNVPDSLKESSYSNHILYPRLPYHERLQNYIKKRDEIFRLESLEKTIKTRPKRSTVRLRRYFKIRKISKKLLISAIISNQKDMRYYAKISFLGYNELGLLDTGASICCLGSDLATKQFNNLPNYTKCKSFVKTADGSPQTVNGWIDLDITFRNQSKRLKFFIIPSISQRLILGVDFCKAFKIFPDIIGTVDVLTLPTLSECSSDLFNIEGKSDCEASDKHQFEESFYPLSETQRTQLNTVISLFPNFEKQGLGRTNLIKHKIDVAKALPIKQRYYPVSPAIEKLMFKEIDRMLSLGVIEASSSPWSSPMMHVR